MTTSEYVGWFLSCLVLLEIIGLWILWIVYKIRSGRK